MKNALFSFSSISRFKSCPKGYEYKYIEKLPEDFVSIEGYLGTSVHTTLEWAYQERIEGKEPDLTDVHENFKQAFWNKENLEKTRIIKDGATVINYFDQGKEFITFFFKRIFSCDNSTTLQLEHKFEICLADEIKYKGVIDRVAKGEDGIIRVIDFKTGRAVHPMSNLQLPSYALYIFEQNIDNEICLCIEDLSKQRTMAIPFQREDVKYVRSGLLQEIEQILLTEDFKTNPSGLCRWCGYNQVCDNPHDSEKNLNCPHCGGELVKRNGKYGLFMGCSNFPRCKYTYDLDSSGKEKIVNADTEGKDICPECGSLLIERKGRFGLFTGCMSYPQCRFTRLIDTGLNTEATRDTKKR